MGEQLPPVLQPPSRPRRLKLHRFQWIGLPLMMLVPVLALFGVFGETEVRVEERGEDLALVAEYFTRYRYKQLNEMKLFVENTSARVADTLTLAFDPAYVARFSTLVFIPSPKEPFKIELLGVKPHERRLVWAELQAERYGRHTGEIQAYINGRTDTTRLRVSTFIFP